MDSSPVEYLMGCCFFLCFFFFWPPSLTLDLTYPFSIGKDLPWAGVVQGAETESGHRKAIVLILFLLTTPAARTVCQHVFIYIIIFFCTDNA